MNTGKATPLHVHPEADETTYVLEGEIQTQVEGTQESLGPGAVLMVPRGANPTRFSNASWPQPSEHGSRSWARHRSLRWRRHRQPRPSQPISRARDGCHRMISIDPTTLRNVSS
ncbi:MAG: cupin domain-containing protein [Betaproteobacteria bacterium]